MKKQTEEGNSLDYTVPSSDSGAGEITITCLVTDEAGSEIEGTVETIQYFAQIRLGGSDGEILDPDEPAKELWAGQEVNLFLELLPNNLVNDASFSWNINVDTCVASYDVSDSSGHYTTINSSHLEQQSIIFYFLNGDRLGLPEDISVDFIYDGNTDTFSADFELLCVSVL